ncbi:MAG: hypothetical protein VKJ02_08960 [Snowella sp.]|nr:hypothetical protein [Snowella sp.]
MIQITPNLMQFRLSPLIKITLISLYLTLTIPLPFLAKFTQTPISPQLLWLGISLGLILLIAVLSEQVIVDDTKIALGYPRWVPSQFRKGWSLAWTEIKDLKMRTTGQGGLVYYLTTQAEDRAYLLPMRIAGFARLVDIIQTKTGIDTSDVRPLSQPWMYLILFIFTVFLGLIDAWTIVAAMTSMN